MDMGAIRSTKLLYKGRILRKLIECLDRKVDFKVDILTAIMTLSNAWHSVSETVLQSSFSKAKLLNISEEIQTEEAEAIWDERFGTGISFEDFVDADNNVMTYEPMNDAEIVEEVAGDDAAGDDAAGDNGSSDGEEDPVIEREMISSQQAMDKIEQLKHFIMRQKTPADEQFKSLECLENWLENERLNNNVQIKITNFFKPLALDVLPQKSKSSVLTVEPVEAEVMTNYIELAVEEAINDEIEEMDGSCSDGIPEDSTDDHEIVNSDRIGYKRQNRGKLVLSSDAEDSEDEFDTQELMDLVEENRSSFRK